MKNRGQAAMEFLMTYGWAILAAIIVIAVIAIYFKPSSLTGQASIFSPPFTALSQSINASSADVEIRNSGGSTVTLSAVPTVTVTSPTGTTCNVILSNSTAGQGGASVAYSPYSWDSGVVSFLRCTPGSSLTKGNTFSADVTITYKSGQGSIPLISTGTISGKIN